MFWESSDVDNACNVRAAPSILLFLFFGGFFCCPFHHSTGAASLRRILLPTAIITAANGRPFRRYAIATSGKRGSHNNTIAAPS